MRRAFSMLSAGVALACTGPSGGSGANGPDSGLDSGTDERLVQDAAYYEAEPGEPVTVQLVAADFWELVTAADDPYDHRPDDIQCSSLGYFEEDDTFEVDTEACTYGTFRQPLLHDLRAGDEALAIYWFDELWAAEPAGSSTTGWPFPAAPRPAGPPGSPPATSPPASG